MKTTKIIVSLLICLMILGSAFGCAATPDTTDENISETVDSQATKETTEEAEPVEIYIYQSKYEIDEALKAACAEYTELNPNVTFVIESKSSTDFQTQLKVMFSAGNAPDIFSTTGNVDLQLMSEYMFDLSDESWVQYMSTAAMEGGSIDGVVYGFPLAVEGHGYIYHKDMFEDAGITELPTTISELRTVCEKLEAAGYQPFTSLFAGYYQSAMFRLNSPIARQEDTIAFIEGLNEGTIQFTNYQDFYDMATATMLEVEYSVNPISTDLNTMVANFTTGEAAMMLGGTWSQPALDAVDSDMDIGFFPMPMNDNADSNDKFYVSCAPFWSVSNTSDNIEESKKFLEWLATSPEGQGHLTSEFKLIPAFTNVEADSEAIGITGVILKKYMDAGKTYGIYGSYYPQGLGGAQVLGETIIKFAAGKLTVDELLEQLQTDWESLQ